MMLPDPAAASGPLRLLSWLSTPLAKIDGHAGASTTVAGALLAPSTVITRVAEFLPRADAGVTKLICVALRKSTSTGAPSSVADTFVPAKFVPKTVPSEPATSGVGSKVAALTMRDTVTAG